MINNLVTDFTSSIGWPPAAATLPAFENNSVITTKLIGNIVRIIRLLLAFFVLINIVPISNAI